MYLQEEARLHDVDWRVQRAGAEAVKSFDSLSFLGATFELVKAKRSRRSHLRAFRGLVDTLKGQLEATHHPNAHAANVTMAAREAQEGAERLRRELAAPRSSTTWPHPPKAWERPSSIACKSCLKGCRRR